MCQAGADFNHWVNRELANFDSSVGLSTTITAIVNNPLPTIATIGLTLIGVPPPLASAMVTAAQGGSLEDIAISAGKAYISGKVGDYAGKSFAGSEYAKNLTPATTAAITQIVTSASGAAAGTALSGGSFQDVLKSGFNAGVSSYVTTSLMKEMGYTDPNKLDAKLVQGAISSATGAILAGKDIGKAITGSVTSTLLRTGIETGVNTLVKNSETLTGLQTSINEKKKDFDAYVKDIFTPEKAKVDTAYTTAKTAHDALAPKINAYNTDLVPYQTLAKDASEIMDSLPADEQRLLISRVNALAAPLLAKQADIKTANENFTTANTAYTDASTSFATVSNDYNTRITDLNNLYDQANTLVDTNTKLAEDIGTKTGKYQTAAAEETDRLTAAAKLEADKFIADAKKTADKVEADRVEAATQDTITGGTDFKAIDALASNAGDLKTDISAADVASILGNKGVVQPGVVLASAATDTGTRTDAGTRGGTPLDNLAAGETVGSGTSQTEDGVSTTRWEVTGTNSKGEPYTYSIIKDADDPKGAWTYEYSQGDGVLPDSVITSSRTKPDFEVAGTGTKPPSVDETLVDSGADTVTGVTATDDSAGRLSDGTGTSTNNTSIVDSTVANLVIAGVDPNLALNLAMSTGSGGLTGADTGTDTGNLPGADTSAGNLPGAGTDTGTDTGNLPGAGTDTGTDTGGLTGAGTFSGSTDDIDQTLAGLDTGINTGTGTDTITSTTVVTKPVVCAEGFHEVGGLCMPDDDEEEDTTCPEGYLYNFGTKTCEKVTDTTVITKPVITTPVVTKPVVTTPVVTTPSTNSGLPSLSYADKTASPGGGLLHLGKMGESMSRHELKQLYDSLVKDSSPNYSYVNDVNPETVDILKTNTLPFSTPQPNYSAYSGYAQGGTVQALAEGAQPDQSYAVQDTMAALNKLGALGFDGKPDRPQILKQGQMGGTYNPRVLPQLAALLRARGMTLAEGGQPDDHAHPNYDGVALLRTGGLSGLGGKYVEGKGDGTSDDIAAMLADGEYVFSADVVAALGNGSNKAGAEELDRMVQAIRSRARSAPPDKLPPDAKSPLEYMKSSKGKKHA